jgi:muconolactone D-isomerase
MLFHVTMTVSIPYGLDPAHIEGLKVAERARCQELMASGAWRHIWRVAGQYKNVSIFDVSDVNELHGILSGLPLFPFMEIIVTPLCRHPSSIRDDDR